MDLESPAIIARRLRAQRLTGQRSATPSEAVAWLGAVQGQEWAEAKWSLAQRTRGEVTDADVQAAHDRGEILRTHVLRPTWHLVTPDDLRRLLDLTSARILTAYPGALPRTRPRRRHACPRR